MKNLSPRIFTLVISVLTGFLAAFFSCFLFSQDLVLNDVYRSLVLFLIVSCSIYFILFFSLKAFLLKRMEVLYKTIFTNKASKDEKEVMQIDYLNHIEKEVSLWLGKKSDELQALALRENYQKEFIGNVSHELKTPAFQVQGYILTLLEGGLEDSRINKTYLKKAEIGIDRMIQIIEDLDTITKLDASQLELKKERFDLQALIEDCMHDFEHANKALTQHIHNKSHKLTFVFADKNKIRQVFINLIHNAVKYGKEDGIITIYANAFEGKILVSISDDGPGIAEHHLPRIFERFYRIEESRARNTGGSGLGLSIVKSIIDAHQESINVVSRVGEGTTFSFTLSKAQG